MIHPAHDSRMIHGAVTLLSFNLFSRGMFLDRLQAAIEAGETIEPESEAERILADDVKTLRMLALMIEQKRAQLIDNAMPKFLLIERKTHAR